MNDPEYEGDLSFWATLGLIVLGFVIVGLIVFSLLMAVGFGDRESLDAPLVELNGVRTR